MGRLTEALGILKDLGSSGRLPPANQEWIALVAKALAEAKAAK